MTFPLDKTKYKLQDIIGRGSYASVYIAQCLTNEKLVAIKVINLQLCPIDLNQLQEEVSFWEKSKHKNMLKYYGSFIDGTSLWFLTELMEGSCYDIIHYSYKRGFKDEVLIATILSEVVNLLVYLHDNKQVHRQIRTSNIFFAKNGDVKVADFGLALGLLNEANQKKHHKKSVVGFTIYMPPEALQDGSCFTSSSDIWSLGVTAIELATGSNPYSSRQDPIEQMKMITSKNTPRLPETYSSEFKDFVSKCLEYEPENRATASELARHPFLKKATATNYIETNVLENLPSLPERFTVIFNQRKQAGSDGIPKEMKPMMFSFDEKEENETKNTVRPPSVKVGRFTVTVDNPIPETHHDNDRDPDHGMIPVGQPKNKESPDSLKKQNENLPNPNVKPLSELFTDLKYLVSRTSSLEMATMDLYDQVTSATEAVQKLKEQKK
ncbi:hypothetical protein M9Y10_035580 [Tritrichomonas musculus]|uniref:Protein kinase domain-containing protein n=1 Tax=Tritrichomonas musculus TaxID=1915356 RepID=A0ABR2GW64_9EUKA